MDVDITIQFYQDKIGTLSEAKKQAFERTVEAVLSDIKTSGTVPKDTGMLEDSGYVEIGDMVAQILFDTPYARRLYWNPEYNFRTDKNPNAQGLWMQAYIDGDKKDFIVNTFAKFFKNLSKGLIQ